MRDFARLSQHRGVHSGVYLGAGIDLAGIDLAAAAADAVAAVVVTGGW